MPLCEEGFAPLPSPPAEKAWERRAQAQGLTWPFHLSNLLTAWIHILWNSWAAFMAPQSQGWPLPTSQAAHPFPPLHVVT